MTIYDVMDHSDCLIMIHVDCPEGTDLLYHLYEEAALDCWYVEIKPPFTRCGTSQKARTPDSLCIVFRLASLISPAMEVSALLKAINSDYTSYVVFKTRDKGYEIDCAGNILKTWELDDGMC